MNEKGKKQKRDSMIKWIVLLLILIILILGIITLIVLLKRGNRVENIVEIIVSTENSGDGVGLTIDPDAGSGQMSDHALEQDVAISGRRTMTIPADKREIAVDFYNPKENEGAYYLTFELRLCDDSESGYEVLYTSGLIEPGNHIDRIELSRALDKGVYDAVVHIQPYRMDEGKTHTNNADIKITLVVN